MLRALVMDDDLLFTTRIANGLRALGFDVLVSMQPEPADLIAINLASPRFNGVAMLPEIQGIPIIAYAGHKERDIRERARAFGIERVASNSEIANKLPQLVDDALRRCTLHADDARATATIGERIGMRLRIGDLVGLIGPIGAGKTTLVQGIAHGMGIGEPARSPTFTLIHEYLAPTPLYHIDLYRLEDESPVAELGLDEYFSRGVVVIEWAERAGVLLPADRLTIEIRITSDEGRDFEIRGGGPRSGALVKEIRSIVAHTGH